MSRPHVSEAYRRHYIDHTSGCFIKASWRVYVLSQPQPRNLVFGGMQPRTACVYVPDGWHATEDGAVEAIEARAQIMVPVGPSTRRTVLVLGARERDQPLAVSLKGRTVWSGTLRQDQKIELPIALSARDADKDKLVQLELTDGRNDDEDLKLALYSFTVD